MRRTKTAATKSVSSQSTQPPSAFGLLQRLVVIARINNRISARLYQLINNYNCNYNKTTAEENQLEIQKMQSLSTLCHFLNCRQIHSVYFESVLCATLLLYSLYLSISDSGFVFCLTCACVHLSAGTATCRQSVIIIIIIII